jgi:hypothetical protein
MNRNKFIEKITYKVLNLENSIIFFSKQYDMCIIDHKEYNQQEKYQERYSKTKLGFTKEEQIGGYIELINPYKFELYQGKKETRTITINSENKEGKIIKEDEKYEFENENVNKIPIGISTVNIKVENLEKSINFYKNILEMNIFEKNTNSYLLGYEEDSIKIKILQKEKKSFSFFNKKYKSENSITISIPLLNEFLNEKNIIYSKKIKYLGLMDENSYKVIEDVDENVFVLVDPDLCKNSDFTPKIDFILRKKFNFSWGFIFLLLIINCILVILSPALTIFF